MFIFINSGTGSDLFFFLPTFLNLLNQNAMKTPLQSSVRGRISAFLSLLLFFGFSSFSLQAQSLFESFNEKLSHPNAMEEDLAAMGRTAVIVEFHSNVTSTKGLSELQLAQFRSSVERMQQNIMLQLEPHMLKNVRKYRSIPAMALWTDKQGMEALLSIPEVKKIHYDEAYFPLLEQSTSLINADVLWGLGYSGDGQTVVVMDTGIDLDHEFFDGKIVAEACFSTEDPGRDTNTLCPDESETQIGPGAAMDCEGASGCGHGTHVAGIAVGSGPSLSGVAHGADIIAIQVFSKFNDEEDCSPGSTPCVRSFNSDMLMALEHVYEDLRHDFPIASINISIGGGSHTTACHDDIRSSIINDLRSVNIATVIAAGNDGFTDAISAPACIPSAIAVGNTTKGDNVWASSNSSELVDLLAPGRSINASVMGGGYEEKTGTSMAAPHVAGAFALLRESNPDESVNEILNRLKRTGVMINDPKSGIEKPRVNLHRAASQKFITQNITENTTWGADATTTYFIENNIRILNGVELTILDNVTVLFDEGVQLEVNGKLVADHVLFTANHEDPDPLFWRRIYVNGGEVEMRNCVVEFAGNASNATFYVINGGSLNLEATSVVDGFRGVHFHTGTGDFSSVDILRMANHGIYLQTNASLDMEDGEISQTDWPVFFEGPAGFALSGNLTVADNTNQAFYIQFSSQNKDFTMPSAPVPYYVHNNYTVGSGYVLTVDPDNIIKVANNRRFTINGTLIADAEPESTIYFTSYADDNLGGDTNNDGSGTLPTATSWYGIDIHETGSDTSLVRNVQLSFAGVTTVSSPRGALNLFGTSPLVENCLFINNAYGIVLYGVAAPELNENTIGVSTVVPIAMQLSADPVFSNNTFSFQANQYDAIGLIGGVIAADAYLPKRNVTDVENVTYLLLDNVTVPEGISLEIEAGVVIKSLQHRRITVSGTLEARGSETEKIVFTSWKDDNFGNPNDTNKDGNQTVPVVGDWYGFYFTDSADDASIFDHVIIQFARSNDIRIANQWYNGAAVMVNGSSPTFSNMEIRNVNIGISLIGNSESEMQNNHFVNTASVPVALSMAADPAFSGNSFTNAEIIALGLIGEELGLDGEVNKKNFAGIENITYFLLGNITIKSNAYISVDPGIVFKAGVNTSIFVDGGFQINGTETENVIFTSIKDDNFGNPGDTNNDGNATSPSTNDWGAVMYRGTSNDTYNTIEHAQFWYGRLGLAIQDASPSISNTLFSDAHFFGITVDGAGKPVFEDVKIQNSVMDPILLSVKANPEFNNIIFDSNDSNGIQILEGYASPSQLNSFFTNTTTVGSDAILFQRDIAGINNIAYIVSTRMTIAPSARLTINPGVVIKFHQWGSIRVEGALIADGESDQRIVFTDIRDDSSGGDTNNDGNATSPTTGYWEGIEFHKSGMDDENLIRYADIRYATSSWHTDGSVLQRRSSLSIHSAYLLLEKSIIEQSSGSGIAILGSSNAEIRENQIINIGSTPVRLNMFAQPVFSDNVVLNVGSMAIGIIAETYSVDGTVPIRDFGGYENITYELFENVTVNSGTEITIPEGVVFKRRSAIRFIVNGALIIEGSEDSPVVFTHLSDDHYGNPPDTQNDGAASSPSILNAPWLVFSSSSDDSKCKIEHAVIRYANFGIELNSAAPTLEHIRFEHLNFGIDLGGVSAPVVKNNLFQNLNKTPMQISLVSYPAVTEGNEIAGSTFRAIGIRSETLVQDVSLPARTFAGTERIPYYLEGVYTVGTGAVLTIEPGVIMKFNGGGIDVRKGLIAQGTDDPDGKIVFTDYRDDFYGGDTNVDGAQSKPSGSQWDTWSGIRFMSESLAPFSVLDDVVIRHVYHLTRGAVTAENASPSISNTTLTKSRYGVYATGNANPIINYNDIFDNLVNGIFNRDKSFVIDARHNWWGKDSGPQHESNPGGTGDVVSDAVDFDPWLGSGATRLLLGDVSLTGAIGAFDASLVLRHTVDDIVLNALQLRNAEVSGDGNVTAFDAALILQYAVNLIGFFPAEALQKGLPEIHLASFDFPEARAVMEDRSAEPGDRITLPLRIENAGSLLSFETTLAFNPQWLAFESVEKTALSKDMQLVHRFDEAENVLRISMAGGRPITEAGDLLMLTFIAADDITDRAEAPMAFKRVMANENEITANSKGNLITIEALPETFSLAQNYPNPFNPVTIIEYQLPHDTHVRLVVYDMLGRVVKTLADQTMPAGRHSVAFDAAELASGIYIYRMETSEFVSGKSMMLVK